MKHIPEIAALFFIALLCGLVAAGEPDREQAPTADRERALRDAYEARRVAAQAAGDDLTRQAELAKRRLLDAIVSQREYQRMAEARIAELQAPPPEVPPEVTPPIIPGADGELRIDPGRSLDEVSRLIEQYPGSTVLFQRGVTYRGSLNVNAPATVGAYGSEDRPRPRIEPSAEQPGATLISVDADDVSIRDLEIVGDPFDDPLLHAGVGIRAVGVMNNLLIEGCLIRGAGVNVVAQGLGGSIQNVTLRRNAILDAYPSPPPEAPPEAPPGTSVGEPHSQGGFFEKVQGLTLIGNVVDHNGWREDFRSLGWGAPTKFNHGFYIDENTSGVVARGNLISRSSANGIQFRGGGEATGNLFYRNPIATFLADGPVVFNDNVILAGIDLRVAGRDAGRNWGVELFNKAGMFEARRNIIAHTATDTRGFALKVTVNAGHDGDYAVSDNIVYDWRGGLQIRVDDAETDYDLMLTRNQVQNHDGGWVLRFDALQTPEGRLTIMGNKLWATADAEGPIRWQGQTMGINDLAKVDFGIERVRYLNPERTVESYLLSRLGIENYDAFIDLAKENPGGVAGAINAYIRAGFEVEPWPVYDAIFRTDPLPGTRAIKIINTGNAFWPDGADHDAMPKESVIRAIAREADPDVPLVIDLEHWPSNLNQASRAEVDQTVERLSQIADWMHDENPDLNIGYYGLPPIRDYWTPVEADEQKMRRWREANDAIAPLVDHIDAIYPSLYEFYDAPERWAVYAEANLAEARRLAGASGDKPVIAFLWPAYHGSNAELGLEPIPADDWRAQLELVRDRADGLVVWRASIGMPEARSQDWWGATVNWLGEQQ